MENICSFAQNISRIKTGLHCASELSYTRRYPIRYVIGEHGEVISTNMTAHISPQQRGWLSQ